MRIDEYELIEFFGVLPSPQPTEEKDFFGTTLFSVERGEWKLSMSFVEYEDLIVATLTRSGEAITEVRISGVTTVRIRRDKANTEPVMVIAAVEDGRDEPEMVAEIRVTPSPAIKVHNRVRFA